jgi:thiamine pyrophosphokinase
MDSLDGNDRLRFYPASQIIRYDAEKDFTDTELALALLREKNCTEIWIIGGSGGRIDHLFGIREHFEGEHYPNRWITTAEDIYCIDGIENRNFVQTLLPGNIVSVLPLGSGPWKAESFGLKWALNNVCWERGKFGLSNIAKSEKIEINVKQGRFMIILEEIWQQY